MKTRKIFLHLETKLIYYRLFVNIIFGHKTFIHSQHLYGYRNGMHTVHQNRQMSLTVWPGCVFDTSTVQPGRKETSVGDPEKDFEHRQAMSQPVSTAEVDSKCFRDGYSMFPDHTWQIPNHQILERHHQRLAYNWSHNVSQVNSTHRQSSQIKQINHLPKNIMRYIFSKKYIKSDVCD